MTSSPDQTPSPEFPVTRPAEAGDGVSSSTLPVGTRVIRNPATWQPNEFDSWGRGEGIGTVVEPPFPLDPTEVDVRWPTGRCFESLSGLQILDAVAPPRQNAD